jgi:hypothetical protein
MSNWLVVYQRSTGKVRAFERIEDLAEAMRRRRLYEQDKSDIADSSDIEVVVLRAETEADLRRTHGRYFRRPEELLGDIA